MSSNKFTQILNKAENKTAEELPVSDAFEVVHEITKDRLLTPAHKWKLIKQFTRDVLTVGDIKESLSHD